MSDKVKRIVILPYFGKFNCYFKLWLDSCAYNKDIDWLIVTDAEFPCDIPANVKVIKTTLQDLKNDFQSNFDFKIKLDKPYKLCDYKPLYGFLFQEHIKEYDFWGYCDCDLVFGDIDSFIPADTYKNYDKVLRNGHLSFVRNIKEINEIFKKYDTYRVVMASPAIYNYDEALTAFRPGYAFELIDSGHTVYQNPTAFADIKYNKFPFMTVSQPESVCVFSYENGKAFRIDRDSDKNIIKTEVMYFHMQKRAMTVETDFSSDRYLIYPNCIVDYSDELLNSDGFWDNVSTDIDGYFDPNFERKDQFKTNLVRFIYEPNKIKSLKHRFSKH